MLDDEQRALLLAAMDARISTLRELLLDTPHCPTTLDNLRSCEGLRLALERDGHLMRVGAVLH